jgi:hypothetical protein
VCNTRRRLSARVYYWLFSNFFCILIGLSQTSIQRSFIHILPLDELKFDIPTVKRHQPFKLNVRWCTPKYCERCFSIFFCSRMRELMSLPVTGYGPVGGLGHPRPTPSARTRSSDALQDTKRGLIKTKGLSFLSSFRYVLECSYVVGTRLLNKHLNPYTTKDTGRVTDIPSLTMRAVLKASCLR